MEYPFRKRSGLIATQTAFVIIVAVGAAVSSGAEEQTQAEVEARVLFAPIPVIGCDSSIHLAFELHLTNFYRHAGTLRIERLELRGGNALLVSYGASELDTRVMYPGAERRRGREIEGWRSAVVNIWATLPRAAKLPTTLKHRLVFMNEKGKEEIVDGANVALHPGAVVRLGPPLRGGDWFVHHGPGDYQAAHWGSILGSTAA